MRYRVNLLDTWIDKIDLNSAVDQIDRFIRSGTPHQIVTVNVDFLRLGTNDPSFRDLINGAHLAVPDGMPLVWASRLLGTPLQERVTGVELITESARLAAHKGYRPFLLGAAPGVADEAAAILCARNAGLEIAGTYAPPIGPFGEAEEEKMLHLIREAQPDLLFVAFGAPKQDRWIRANLARLGVPVCMGVGGSFDFIAGRVKRAPYWMQEGGLEWLYRVMQEPTRLWKRYLLDDLPIFMRLMLQGQSGSPSAQAMTGLLERSAMIGDELLEPLVVERSGVHVA